MISGELIIGGAALLLTGFVLGSRLREGRDLMTPPIQPPVVRRPAAPTQSSETALTPDSQSAIAAALRAGNKIGAIKLYRAAAGADLKASKDAVEAMAG